MENLIGRKVRGFKFDKIQGLKYYRHMDKYINNIGEIINQYDLDLDVRFENGDIRQYPLDQIKEHLVDERQPSISKVLDFYKDVESIEWVKGIVINLSDYEDLSKMRYKLSSEYWDLKHKSDRKQSIALWNQSGFPEVISRKQSVSEYLQERTLTKDCGIYLRSDIELLKSALDEQRETIEKLTEKLNNARKSLE